MLDFNEMLEDYEAKMPEMSEPTPCSCGRYARPFSVDDAEETAEYCDGEWIMVKRTDQQRYAGKSLRIPYIAKGSHFYALRRCPSKEALLPKHPMFFDNFNRDLQPKAYDLCYTWTPETCKHFILAGKPGLGKSHLAHAMYYKLITEGKNCTWLEAPELAELFRRAQGFNEHDQQFYDAERILEKAYNDYAVFLDDLGSERQTKTDIFLEQLQLFLNKIQGGLVVTTNLKEKDLTAEYGDKIASRLFENCIAHGMTGSDFRRNNFKIIR